VLGEHLEDAAAGRDLVEGVAGDAFQLQQAMRFWVSEPVKLPPALAAFSTACSW
jgi:hypothetical protein